MTYNNRTWRRCIKKKNNLGPTSVVFGAVVTCVCVHYYDLLLPIFFIFFYKKSTTYIFFFYYKQPFRPLEQCFRPPPTYATVISSQEIPSTSFMHTITKAWLSGQVSESERERREKNKSHKCFSLFQISGAIQYRRCIGMHGCIVCAYLANMTLHTTMHFEYTTCLHGHDFLRADKEISAVSLGDNVFFYLEKKLFYE